MAVFMTAIIGWHPTVDCCLQADDDRVQDGRPMNTFFHTAPSAAAFDPVAAALPFGAGGQ